MWKFRNYRLMEEAGEAGAGGGAEGTPADGTATGAGVQAGGEADGGGGMLREAAKSGQGGESGDDKDPDFVTDSSDGRPKITTDDGKELPLPDQFWDHENQKVRADALFKSQLDTRQSLRKLQDENKSLKAKVEGRDPDPGEGTIPEKPDDYKFEPPEGSKREIPNDDPLLASFRDIAHANGLSQEKFNAMAGQFIAKIDELTGDPIDPEKEREALGPNAGAVLGAVAGWINSFMEAGVLSQEEADEMLAIGETAAGVRALNKMREATGEKRIPLEGAQISELPSEAELYKMIGSEKYASDETYRKKVDEMAKQVWGTAPAGTSRAGLGVGA